MVLWWIGNILLLVVVAPVVVMLLRRVLTPVQEINEYVADVLEHGVLAIANLDAIDDLEETERVSAELARNGRHYIDALQLGLKQKGA